MPRKQGKKHDDGKLRFDLVDPHFEEDLAAVLTHGANEYGDNNWQKLKNATQRYIAALQRHTNAYKKGEYMDEDSGLPHTAHMAANVMFLDYLARVEDQY